MASRLIARRMQQKKKATNLVSKQTLEQALQEAQDLVNQLTESNSRDERIEQLENAITFLTQILDKSPVDMQQEGATTLDDYLDDSIMPEMARKIKQEVDLIAEIKSGNEPTSDRMGNLPSDRTVEMNTRANEWDKQTIKDRPAPRMGSGSDNWVNDRNEDGTPKKPEVVEVPRVATSKNADLFSTKKAGPVVPFPAAPKAPKPESKPSADITQLSSDTLAKMQKALAGSEDLMNDKAAQAFIAAIAEELMNRPVEVEEAPKPAAAPLPMAASLIGGLQLVAADEDENIRCECGHTEDEHGVSCSCSNSNADSKLASTPPDVSEELMHKLKKEYPGEPEKAYATAWSIHNEKGAALKALNAAAKAASGQGGSWFVADQDTGKLTEDGGRTPEIAEAHNYQEDHTGISRPTTELPSKFASRDLASLVKEMLDMLDKYGSIKLSNGSPFANELKEAYSGKMLNPTPDDITYNCDCAGGVIPKGGCPVHGRHTASNQKTAATDKSLVFLVNELLNLLDEKGKITIPRDCMLANDLREAVKAYNHIHQGSAKTAADMTTNKAVKMVERVGNELRALYLEAKPVTQVLDSRPVREAIESIFRAYDLMGEAAKVLNKQNMQEQAEEQATVIKEKGKKSSILAGLDLAEAEDDNEANLQDQLLEDGDAEQCPACGAISAYSYDNVNYAPLADIEGEGIPEKDRVYYIGTASGFEWECGKCHKSWTPEDSPINHPAYTHSED